MGPTPSYGAMAENPPKKADFAMKQTNICRLSGDSTRYAVSTKLPLFRDVKVSRQVVSRPRPLETPFGGLGLKKY